jgi:hypothetical protein
VLPNISRHSSSVSFLKRLVGFEHSRPISRRPRWGQVPYPPCSPRFLARRRTLRSQGVDRTQTARTFRNLRPVGRRFFRAGQPMSRLHRPALPRRQGRDLRRAIGNPQSAGQQRRTLAGPASETQRWSPDGPILQCDDGLRPGVYDGGSGMSPKRPSEADDETGSGSGHDPWMFDAVSLTEVPRRARSRLHVRTACRLAVSRLGVSRLSYSGMASPSVFATIGRWRK